MMSVYGDERQVYMKINKALTELADSGILASTAGKVQYTFVNAETNEEFVLEFSPGETVSDAREQLQQRYNLPTKDDVTLLFAGKALRDGFVLDRLNIGGNKVVVHIKDRTKVLLYSAVGRNVTPVRPPAVAAMPPAEEEKNPCLVTNIIAKNRNNEPLSEENWRSLVQAANAQDDESIVEYLIEDFGFQRVVKRVKQETTSNDKGVQKIRRLVGIDRTPAEDLTKPFMLNREEDSRKVLIKLKNNEVVTFNCSDETTMLDICKLVSVSNLYWNDSEVDGDMVFTDFDLNDGETLELTEK
jgi:hypothetical protein